MPEDGPGGDQPTAGRTIGVLLPAHSRAGTHNETTELTTL